MSELIDKQAITLLISQLGLAMVTEVVEAFVPDAQQNVLFLQTHWKMDQHKALRIKSHSLKSSSANIGFKQVSSLAKKLEECCLSNNEHEFNKHLGELEALSQVLEASINELALMGLAQRKL